MKPKSDSEESDVLWRE